MYPQGFLIRSERLAFRPFFVVLWLGRVAVGLGMACEGVALLGRVVVYLSVFGEQW